MLLALKKVPKKGLEPSRLAAHAPETCASTIPPLGPLASAKLALFFELASISPHFFFVFLFGGGWVCEMVALWDGREQKVGRRGCEGFRPIVGRRVG